MWCTTINIFIFPGTCSWRSLQMALRYILGKPHYKHHILELKIDAVFGLLESGHMSENCASSATLPARRVCGSLQRFAVHGAQSVLKKSEELLAEGASGAGSIEDPLSDRLRNVLVPAALLVSEQVMSEIVLLGGRGGGRSAVDAGAGRNNRPYHFLGTIASPDIHRDTGAAGGGAGAADVPRLDVLRRQSTSSLAETLSRLRTEQRPRVRASEDEPEAVGEQAVVVLSDDGSAEEDAAVDDDVEIEDRSHAGPDEQPETAVGSSVLLEDPLHEEESYNIIAESIRPGDCGFRPGLVYSRGDADLASFERVCVFHVEKLGVQKQWLQVMAFLQENFVLPRTVEEADGFWHELVRVEQAEVDAATHDHDADAMDQTDGNAMEVDSKVEPTPPPPFRIPGNDFDRTYVDRTTPFSRTRKAFEYLQRLSLLVLAVSTGLRKQFDTPLPLALRLFQMQALGTVWSGLRFLLSTVEDEKSDMSRWSSEQRRAYLLSTEDLPVKMDFLPSRAYLAFDLEQVTVFDAAVSPAKAMEFEKGYRSFFQTPEEEGSTSVQTTDVFQAFTTETEEWQHVYGYWFSSYERTIHDFWDGMAFHGPDDPVRGFTPSQRRLVARGQPIKTIEAAENHSTSQESALGTLLADKFPVLHAGRRALGRGWRNFRLHRAAQLPKVFDNIRTICESKKLEASRREGAGSSEQVPPSPTTASLLTWSDLVSGPFRDDTIQTTGPDGSWNSRREKARGMIGKQGFYKDVRGNWRKGELVQFLAKGEVVHLRTVSGDELRAFHWTRAALEADSYLVKRVHYVNTNEPVQDTGRKEDCFEDGSFEFSIREAAPSAGESTSEGQLLAPRLDSRWGREVDPSCGWVEFVPESLLFWSPRRMSTWSRESSWADINDVEQTLNLERVPIIEPDSADLLLPQEELLATEFKLTSLEADLLKHVAYVALSPQLGNAFGGHRVPHTPERKWRVPKFQNIEGKDTSTLFEKFYQRKEDDDVKVWSWGPATALTDPTAAAAMMCRYFTLDEQSRTGALEAVARIVEISEVGRSGSVDVEKEVKFPGSNGIHLDAKDKTHWKSAVLKRWEAQNGKSHFGVVEDLTEDEMRVVETVRHGLATHPQKEYQTNDPPPRHQVGVPYTSKRFSVRMRFAGPKERSVPLEVYLNRYYDALELLAARELLNTVPTTSNPSVDESERLSRMLQVGRQYHDIPVLGRAAQDRDAPPVQRNEKHKQPSDVDEHRLAARLARESAARRALQSLTALYWYNVLLYAPKGDEAEQDYYPLEVAPSEETGQISPTSIADSIAPYREVRAELVYYFSEEARRHNAAEAEAVHEK